MKTTSQEAQPQRKILAPSGFLGLGLWLFLSGCSTAQVLREDFEPEKGGIVSYSGSDAERGRSEHEPRRKALQMAQKFCRGPIKVLAEGVDEVRRLESADSQAEMPWQKQLGSREQVMKFRCSLQGLKGS